MPTVPHKCETAHPTYRDVAACVWSKNLGKVTGEGEYAVVHAVRGTWDSHFDITLCRTIEQLYTALDSHPLNCKDPISICKLPKGASK